MPLYSYRAVIQQSEEIVEGQMTAASEQLVSLKLQQIGYLPIKISEVKETAHARLFSKDISDQDIVFFTSKLSLTLKAGLPLDESLKLIIQTSDSKKLLAFLEKIIAAVQDGVALSDAIQQHSNAFNRFYINTLKAGEVSGGLNEVLSDLTEYLEHQQALKRTLISALIYPVILLVVTMATLIILLLFVVPQFQLVFDQMGQTLPVSTQMVIKASELLENYGLQSAMGLVLCFFLFKFLMNDEQRRYPIDKLVLKIPLLSETILKLETGRFSRTMSTLLSNGVPLLSALEVMFDSINNTVLRNAVKSIKDDVQKGQPLSSSMTKQRLFPPLAVQLLHVGEETGELTSMLRQIADIYDAELKESINRILVMLEPLIIIGLGITVATIIISVLLAILSLNDFVV